MSKFKSFAFLAILLFVLLQGCKKDSLSQLPPATQTGENTFGSLINGKLSVYHNDWTFEGGNSFSVVSSINSLSIYVHDSSNKPPISLVIDSVGTISEGTTYKLSNYNLKAYSYGAVTYLNPYVNTYTTNASVNGSLTITKYSNALVSGHQQKVIAGTFYFNAVNSSGDIVKVTDGRFDLVEQ